MLINAAMIHSGHLESGAITTWFAAGEEKTSKSFLVNMEYRDYFQNPKCLFLKYFHAIRLCLKALKFLSAALIIN
jgi:hypothetical protein